MPVADSTASITASTPMAPAAVTGSSISTYASNRLHVAKTTAPCTHGVMPTMVGATSSGVRLRRSSNSKEAVL